MRYRPPVSPTAAAATCWGSREMQSLLEAAATYLNTLGPREIVWIGIGFLGQFLFMMRFLWQWIQSERQRRSIIPIAFWYFQFGRRHDPSSLRGASAGPGVHYRPDARTNGLHP